MANKQSTLVTSEVPTAIGALQLIATHDALVGLRFAQHRPALTLHAAAMTRVASREHAVLAQAERQLEQFFAGERRSFSLPLAPQGTAFQLRVWRALLEIPFGETCSYGALAAAIGRPTASRAVGAANGRNPLAIFVPCHRVIGADGGLTGFAGGYEAKRFLLALEGGERALVHDDRAPKARPRVSARALTAPGRSLEQRTSART